LFYQESLAVVSTNPEYEAEKKAKEKKWEKQFTMYLGDVVKGIIFLII
jgi:hypothetical protein